VRLVGGRRLAAPPDPYQLTPRRLLLASEGRPISPAAVDFAARVAEAAKADIRVFSVARVWGTGLGLPMPGLLPSKHEWDEQREIVTRAVRALRKRGLSAQGHVLGTRRAARRILSEAARLECDAIVMGADAPRPWLVADFMWSQEPYRVARRSRLPVYLVREDREAQ